jgi:site-specific DNA recombinase
MNGAQTSERVALYVRVSTEEQANEGVSIDAQLAALRASARLNNWLVADEYVDAGYTGGNGERPALQRLLLDAKAHKFNVVAVARLDRFYRNLRLLLNTIHEFDELGINFIATQENLNTSTTMGRFSLQIMGVIAEWERGRISERIRDAQTQLVKSGYWKSGKTPYGYLWLAKERRWEVVEDEAQVVRYIYRLYTGEKLGIEKIVLRLNSEGYRTRRNMLWKYSTVHAILTHPTYQGKHSLGLQMPAIVDGETWELAQRNRKQARSIKKEVHDWLLQGIGVCGLCGHVLHCRQAKPNKPRYYACNGRNKISHVDGSERCTLPWFKAESLEQTAWIAIAGALSNNGVLKQAVEDALHKVEQKRRVIGQEAEPLDLQLARLRTRKERLAIAFADEAISETAYKDNLQMIREQETGIMARKANLDPEAQLEIAELDSYIKGIKEFLANGWFRLEKDGIVGYLLTKEGPEPDFYPYTLLKGETHKGECLEVTEKGNGVRIKLNMNIDDMDKGWIKAAREMMHLFQIGIKAFPDRIEVRGLIPSRLLQQIQLSDGYPENMGIHRQGWLTQGKKQHTAGCLMSYPGQTH